MITIKESLALEHVFLGRLFNEVDRLLPEVQTLAEVRFLCRIVENLLSHHADIEQNLAYAALDQALSEQGELDQLYQDHEEIDARFEQAREAAQVAAARRLLKEALAVSSHHFRWEEDSVFPLFDRLFTASALVALGTEARSRFGAETLDCTGHAPTSRADVQAAG
jgi:hemerythrin-like domain-containing protein